jgi:hypothetical protein
MPRALHWNGEFLSLRVGPSWNVLVWRGPNVLTIKIRQGRHYQSSHLLLERGFLGATKLVANPDGASLQVNVTEQPRVSIANGILRIASLDRVAPAPLEFSRTPVRQVVARIAERMDKRYLIAPKVVGRVSGCFEGAQHPLACALSPLRLTTRESPHFVAIGTRAQLKLLDLQLLERAFLGNFGFQEVLLEKADARKVMHFLERRYPAVLFNLNWPRNGFYLSGSRTDVLQIKSEVPNLDRAR